MKFRFRAFQGKRGGAGLYGARSERDHRWKGLLTSEDELVWEIDAYTFDEALAIHELRLGHAPFLPVGDPSPCPNCGAIYYPESSGVCWSCGFSVDEGCEGRPAEAFQDVNAVELHPRYRYRAYRDSSGQLSLYSSDEETEARAAGRLAPDARLAWEIEVDTPEEARTIYRLRMGMQPYCPKGDDAPCPRCGVVYYPDDSGVCWRCGPISEA